MTNRINQKTFSGAAAVAEFNRKFTPNTPCFYQPVRSEDKWYPTRTRSEAWMLGHGDVVVKVDGTSGCVSIEHLAMPGSDRYKAAIDESEKARVANVAMQLLAESEAAPLQITLQDGMNRYDAMIAERACSDHARAQHRIFSETAERLFESIKEIGVGRVTDGYHTFEELYAHRVRLFSTLMHAYKDRAWWSHKHSDGSQWDGWIIAGIQTPAGMVTYHLPVSEIEHLPAYTEIQEGKLWDGHTADDVILRLASLNGARDCIAIDGQEEEQAIYHYAASVNLPQGQIHYDGVLIGPMISSMADYMNYRAQIASDAKANVDQVQVHSLSIAGVKEAADGHTENS